MELISQQSRDLDRTLLERLSVDIGQGLTNILLPAGGTPRGFYSLLREDKRGVWNKAKFYQIDDILEGIREGHFLNFFKKELDHRFFQLVPIKDCRYFPPTPHVSFLGLGVNGHVAFHEPHIPHDFKLGCVELGIDTLRYLRLELGTWGMTMGLGVFMESEKIYLMVKGRHKKDILRRFLSEDEAVPASVLLKHKNLVLLVDDEVYDN